MSGPRDTVSGSRMRYVFIRGQERPTILKHVPGVGVETIPPQGHGESTITITDHDDARGINQTFYNLQRHLMGDTQGSRGATASASTEAGTQESRGMKCPVCLESYLGIKGRGKIVFYIWILYFALIIYRRAVVLHGVRARVLWPVSRHVPPHQWSVSHV